MIAAHLAGTTVSAVVLFRELRKTVAFGTEVGSSIGQSLEGIKSRRSHCRYLCRWSSGAKYVVLALGVNDILFPGSFIPSTETVAAQSLIYGNRQLIARAHRRGIRVIGTTIPPFENSIFRSPPISFSTPEKELVRREVNAWIRTSGEFDAVVDFDELLRDPTHPARLLPLYDSGDHLHVNDAGNIASGNGIPVGFFHRR